MLDDHFLPAQFGQSQPKHFSGGLDVSPLRGVRSAIGAEVFEAVLGGADLGLDECKTGHVVLS
jgi:hypothetical protein